MRRLLCTALLLLCCAYGCIAAVVQPLPKRGQGPWDTYTVSVADTDDDDDPTEKVKENWQPIRIAVSPKGVSDAVHYCRSRKLGARWGYPRKTNFDQALCHPTEGMTLERANLFVNKILRAAIRLHAERLKVKRESGKLIITGDTVLFFGKLCPEVKIPSEHEKEGVANADFVLYAGVSIYKPDTVVCSYNLQKRPIAASMNIRPKDIADTRHFTRIVAHELGHGLGFDNMALNKVSALVSVVRNDVHYELRHALIKEKVSEHYGCPAATGMRLEKDKGNQVIRHFDRRIAKDELMSPYSGSSNGMFYTALTLAVFESTGHYKANFAKAENMSWGRNAGCVFLKKKCRDDSLSNYGDMFCDIDSAGPLQCTSDRFALGKCSQTWKSDALSWQKCMSRYAENEMAELDDVCPIIK
ncbi:surface protease GP63, partial [Trypanosoma theileri]